MSEYAIPSHDPANAGGLAGTLREVFKKLMQGIDDMLPAKIVTYDRKRNTATVKAQIMVLTTENQLVTRPLHASVPVLALGGGHFVMNFPLKPGDTGWIKANDRDISLYLQSDTETGPNTQRLHSFADGLFIPDVMRHYTLADEDADSAVLQSTEGAVRIALSKEKITHTAPIIEHNAENAVMQSTDGAARITLSKEKITHTAPVIKLNAENTVLQSADGTVRIALSQEKITLTAPTIELQAKEVICQGNLATQGRVIGQGGVTFGNTPAESHRHIGVTIGAEISGGPI